MKDQALWQRLLSFEFPLSRAPWRLSRQVASEVGLTDEQANRVVHEYRRFLYLAATAEEDVAPSPLIDEVWRMHLKDRPAPSSPLWTYVIGRVIEPRSGRPPPVRDPVYARTLALYRAEFGEAPFDRIWPDARQLRRQRRAIAALIAGLPFAFLATLIDSVSDPAAALVFVGGLAMFIVGFVWMLLASSWGATRPDG